MIDKTKTILTAILIVIVVFAVGYSIVRLIISAFKEPTLVTMDTLSKYNTNENIVTGYTTYYYYEGCVENLLEACKKEMYNELYDIYIKDYAKKSSEEKIINDLKNIKTLLTPKDIDEQITYKLDMLYAVGSDYLAKVSINNNTIYILFAEASAKELSYNFALID